MLLLGSHILVIDWPRLRSRRLVITASGTRTIGAPRVPDRFNVHILDDLTEPTVAVGYLNFALCTNRLVVEIVDQPCVGIVNLLTTAQGPWPGRRALRVVVFSLYASPGARPLHRGRRLLRARRIRSTRRRRRPRLISPRHPGTGTTDERRPNPQRHRQCANPTHITATASRGNLHRINPRHTHRTPGHH